MKFEDFLDSEKITQFIQENHDNICSHKYMIIDVRVNHGGSDINYYPLIPYCFPKGKSIVNPNEEYGCEVNYTKHNVELRMALFKSFLNQEISEEMRELLEYMCTHFENKKGVGFIREEDSAEVELPVGKDGPEKIVILTDYECGSAGELFVENFKSSDKVVVIGRPTAGIIDYANEATEDFGEYHFMYPTSRRCAIDHEIQLADKGVPVDMYIPWTPEMIYEDLDLKKAKFVFESDRI